MAAATPSFPYIASTRVLLRLMVLCAVLSAWQGYLLATSAGGYTVVEVLGRTAVDDTRHVGLAFLFNVCGLVVLALAWTRRKSSTRRLELNDSYLLAPASRWILSTYEQVIPYKSVTRLELAGSGRKRILRVHHRAGRLVVQEVLMASSNDFDSFHRLLGDKVASRAQSGR